MIINLELYPDKAPNTVDNFISLAVKGFYDGLTFHRIIEGFMIQGGCPDGTGMGGPGYQIPGEFASNGFEGNDIKHTAGVISMARSSAMDSAGSQFFIMAGSSPHLDGEYAAFGKTADEKSLQNCLELSKARVSGDRPIDPPRIKSIKIDTKGVDYGEPNHS
jgi:peptidyl-prolyl cis-trans isomerase B (cyclophilin B)